METPPFRIAFMGAHAPAKVCLS